MSLVENAFRRRRIRNKMGSLFIANFLINKQQILNMMRYLFKFQIGRVQHVSSAS
jgi:hypothetical protein